MRLFGKEKNVEEWFNECETLFKLGKYEEAIKCYDQAIEIDPNFALVWISKSIALGQLGKTDEAEKCFEIAKELEK